MTKVACFPSKVWAPSQSPPMIVDAVDIPVMAAGGINDRRGVDAAFALGAQGVYLGTRFIATKESPAADETKQLIVNSGYADMELVSARQRSISTALAKNLAERFRDPALAAGMDQEIARHGGLRPAMREGRLDEGIVSVNTGIDAIHDVPSVASLVECLMTGGVK